MQVILATVLWFLLIGQSFGSSQGRRFSQIVAGEAPEFVYLSFDTPQTIEFVTKLDNWKKNSWPLNIYGEEIWVKFRLFNDTNSVQEVVLEDQWSLTDYLTIFLFHNNVQTYTKTDGDFSKIEERPFENRFPTFRFEIQPGPNDIYLRYKSSDLPGVRLRQFQSNQFLTMYHKEFLLLGSIFGCMAIMVIYSFCIYMVLKDKSYLYYSFYMSSFLLFQGFHSGFFFSMGLDSSMLWQHCLIFSACLAIVSVPLFSKELLHIDPKSIPYKTANYINYFIVLIIPVQFISYQWSIHLIAAADILLVTWVLYTACSYFHRREVVVYIYALAWGILSIADIYTVSYYIGVISPNWFTKWGFLLGAAMEASLISFALAYKVHVLKKKAMEAEVSQSKLAVAKAIQDSIIKISEDIPEINLKSLYLAAEETGGDWLYVSHSPIINRVYIVVGDVTDHGVGSAIITGVIRGSVETSISWAEQQVLCSEDTMKNIANKLGKVIFQTGKIHGRLMTANIIILDLDKDKGYLLNAGHHACYLKNPKVKKITSLFPRGDILGLEMEQSHSIITFPFDSGVRLMTYTDGVIENHNLKGDSFKKKKLIQIFNDSDTIADTISNIESHGNIYWNHDHLRDDISLLIVERKDANAKILSPTG